MFDEIPKCALPGKVIQGSSCPEVCTLTNANGRYIMRLNDTYIIYIIILLQGCKL